MSFLLNKMRATLIYTASLFVVMALFNTPLHAEGKFIKGLPWGASAGVKYGEYLEEGDIADGYSGSISYRQAILFHHPAEKWFNLGIFAKYAYKESDNLARSWENKTTNTVGLELYKIYSTKHISWGKASLTISQATDRHNEFRSQGADVSANSISFSISASGDWLK